VVLKTPRGHTLRKNAVVFVPPSLSLHHGPLVHHEPVRSARLDRNDPDVADTSPQKSEHLDKNSVPEKKLE